MSFIKRYEIYTPEDLCWLHVTLDTMSNSVTIQNKNAQGAPTVLLSDGAPDQLQQLVDILKHILKVRHGRPQ